MVHCLKTKNTVEVVEDLAVQSTSLLSIVEKYCTSKGGVGMVFVGEVGTFIFPGILFL